MGFFDKVYPFTTESISGYMKHMDVKDKSVLTVGSSMDQALNACLYGAKDITVMDISKTTKDYMLYKLYLILNTHSTDELYKAICNTRDYKLSREELFGLDALRKMSPYLESEETYNRLKENIMKSTFQFIHGDIFKMDQAVGNKKYDRIILSNVLYHKSSRFASVFWKRRKNMFYHTEISGTAASETSSPLRSVLWRVQTNFPSSERICSFSP